MAKAKATGKVTQVIGAVVDVAFVLEGELIDEAGQTFRLEVEVLAIPSEPAIGLYILRDEYAWAQRMIDWMRRKFPHYTKQMDDGRDRAQEWLTRWRRRFRRTVYQVRR